MPGYDIYRVKYEADGATDEAIRALLNRLCDECEWSMRDLNSREAGRAEIEVWIGDHAHAFEETLDSELRAAFPDVEISIRNNGRFEQ